MWQPGSIIRNRKPIVPGGGLLGNHRNGNGRNGSDNCSRLLELREQIRKSCQYASFMFSKMFQESIRWDCDELVQSMKLPDMEPYWCERLAPVIQGKFKGIFTREHILTLATLCQQFMVDRERDILIWGACQGAKTIVLTAAVLVLPVLKRLYHDELLLPVIDCPNRTNLSLSVLKELETLFSVYERMYIVVGKERQSLSYVKTEILDKVVRERTTGVPTWYSLIFQRNKPEIKKFIRVMENGGKNVDRLRVIDELHYGSGLNSVQDQLDEPFKDENTWRRIGVTATPSEVFTRYKWAVVPVWIDERRFMGITRYNGHRHPTISREEPKRPAHVIIEDRFPALERFINVKRFERLPEEDQTEMAKALLAAYKGLVTPDAPVFFLRPMNRVDALHKLLELMEQINRDPDYCFLQYFGSPLPDVFGIDKKTIKRTVKEVLIDDYPPHGGKFCMVVSGQGRSQFGDSYPAHTVHYMDLTDKGCSFWDTILQSTEGRAAGFGKRSIIYYSRKYVTEFQQFFDSGCRDERLRRRKRHGRRVEYGEGGQPRGRPKDHDEIVLPFGEVE